MSGTDRAIGVAGVNTSRHGLIAVSEDRSAPLADVILKSAPFARQDKFLSNSDGWIDNAGE
jgi:hypothetical protein